jgi:hypothetical protein
MIKSDLGDIHTPVGGRPRFSAGTPIETTLHSFKKAGVSRLKIGNF